MHCVFQRAEELSTELGEARNECLSLETQVTQLEHRVQQQEEELQEALEAKSRLSQELSTAQEKAHDTEALKAKIRDLEDEITQVKLDSKVGLLMKGKLVRMEEIEAQNRELKAENEFHR
jgi:SMC interacting uncharacterized protein involved in chromosome segregation